MNINTTINVSLQNALLNYFNTLSDIGYVEYPDVYKLIVLDMINDIISLKLTKYAFPTIVSEDDIRTITTTFYNLVNSTFLIPVPINNNGSTPTPNSYYLDLSYLYKYIAEQIVTINESINTKDEATNDKLDTAVLAINSTLTSINNTLISMNTEISNLGATDNLVIESLNNLASRIKILEFKI